MAREYLKIDEWEKWTPDVDNERELLKSNPDKALSMELRFMTLQERKDVQRYGASALRGLLDDDDYNKQMLSIFKRHVRNVKNYTYNGKPVTTGEELFQAAEEDLVSSVVRALITRSELEAGLVKKYTTRSAILDLLPMNSGVGGVPSAIPQSRVITPEESARLAI